MDISLRKIHKWLTTHGKMLNITKSLGKCKGENYSEISLGTTRMAVIKGQTVASAGEDEDR